MKIKDGHRSGKFSASADLLYEAAVAGFEKHGWTVQSFTEVDRSERGNALRLAQAKCGCKLLRGPSGDLGESAIMVDLKSWKVLAWSYCVLADDLIGMRRRQVMVIVVLLSPSGFVYLRSVTHTAAGVESDWDSLRSKQYRQAMKRWRKTIRQWRRKWRPDGECHVADFNINLLRAWVRGYLKVTWPGMKLPRHGKRGTLGRRLVDFGLTRGIDDPTMMVLPLQAELSDHRPIENRGTLVRRKRRGKR